MKPWQLLARSPVPASTSELRLYRREREFSIRIDSIELMNSRAAHSEAALCELGCARIFAHTAPRVLIGGLGMGFSLRAALSALPADAQVEVAELVPDVVSWNERYLGELAGHPLRDPRVIVHRQDVAESIRAARASYDAVLLDIDNGPNALIRQANAAVYTASGLRALREALRTDGILGVWSCSPEPGFVRRLTEAGFGVDEMAVRGRTKSRGARYTVWLAAAR